MTPLGVGGSNPASLCRTLWLNSIRLVDVPIRAADGAPRLSRRHYARYCACGGTGHRGGTPTIGARPFTDQKTGLILPDYFPYRCLAPAFLQTRSASLWDACQARISRENGGRPIWRVTARCFLTGSKYVGGPPFSGFAFVPRAVC